MKKPILLAAISLVSILLLAGCGASNDLGGSLSSETGKSAVAEASDLGGSLATGEGNSTSVHKLPQRSLCTSRLKPPVKHDTIFRIAENESFSLNGKAAL